jgi:hypothetical protein
MIIRVIFVCTTLFLLPHGYLWRGKKNTNYNSTVPLLCYFNRDLIPTLMQYFSNSDIIVLLWYFNEQRARRVAAPSFLVIYTWSRKNMDLFCAFHRTNFCKGSPTSATEIGWVCLLVIRIVKSLAFVVCCRMISKVIWSLMPMLTWSRNLSIALGTTC